MQILNAWVTALGPTLLVIVGGLITWLIRTRTEELRAAEERLHDERRRIYDELLDPYIRLFANVKSGGTQQAVQKMVTYEYRKTAFNLNMVGSDSVVLAYNALMKHTYEAEASGQQSPAELFRLWGGLLLEIRRSVGDKRTSLTEMDMLRGMIRDVDSLLT